MHSETLDQFQILNFSFIYCNFSFIFRKASSAPTWAWSVWAIGQFRFFSFSQVFSSWNKSLFLFLVPSAFPQVCSFPCELRLDLGESEAWELVSGCRLIRTNSQLGIVLFVVIISDLFVHVGALEASLPQSLELQAFVTEPLKGISLLRAP